MKFSEDILSHKKPGFQPLSRRYNFRKTTGWGLTQFDPPPL